MRDQGLEYGIRTATIDDAGTAARHRATMFLNMGAVTPDQAEVLRSESERWLSGLLAKGEYVGWLCHQGEAIVAGAGVLLHEMGPRPGCFRVGRAAHVVNVYTEPDHRRRGLARKLMLTVLDWCAEQRIDQVTLTASKDGKPLYETLGFELVSEMKLRRTASLTTTG
jgi:GNAT superfamily N-acetyltransferase